MLTAAEIFDATGSQPWLRERLPSVEAAAKFVLGRRGPNGLVGGSGFYTESPPRYAWDGVTQCYTVHAFRELRGYAGRRETRPVARPGPPTPTGWRRRLPLCAATTSANTFIPSTD